MSTESAQDAAAAAAEKMSEAAGAAADEASPAGDTVEDLLGVGGEGDEWSFLMKAAVAVVVIIVCLIATRVRERERETRRESFELRGHAVAARTEFIEGIVCLVGMPLCSQTSKERNGCLVFVLVRNGGLSMCSPLCRRWWFGDRVSLLEREALRWSCQPSS